MICAGGWTALSLLLSEFITTSPVVAPVQSLLSCSSFKLFPYFPRTYINKLLYGMPNILLACDVVIFLFQTCCNASVNSAFVQDLGGPPLGALCCPFGLPTGRPLLLWSPHLCGVSPSPLCFFGFLPG